jgi:photosystem II stability/assembly factor-like uncharacterized protein
MLFSRSRTYSVRRSTSVKGGRLAVLALESRLAPSGVPSTFTNRGSGGGGALFSPQINPADPSEIYVASDMSQLFHTTNAGTTWQQVDFRQIEGGHQAQVQFTEDPNIRYSLDYSVINGLDEVHPSMSSDGGVTWQRLSHDPTTGEAFYFLADPGNHNRLVVTDYTHVYFSSDAGQTWGLKWTATDSGAGIVLGGAFWDGANIYFGTNDGLLVSTNGGTSFSAASVGGLPSGQVIISFAGAKQGSTTRFLAVTRDAGDTYGGVPGYDNGEAGDNVVTLDWGNANWAVRTVGGSSVFPFFAGMALNNINTMYVAGSGSGDVPTVYKSTNGGQTWQSVLQTDQHQNVDTGWSGFGGDRGWSYGEFALGFAVSATDANRLIMTDLGFAHSSADGGATWQALYVAPGDRNPNNHATPTGDVYHDSGLDNTTAWGVTWADATHVVIANSDVKGQLSLDGGQTFGFGYSGVSLNSIYRVIAHPNGNLYAATGSRHDLYQSTTLTDATLDSATGQVLFSPDKGVTWQLLHNFGHEVAWVAADPTNANRLYAAVVSSTVGGIYVTNNLSAGASSTWTKLANPPRTQGHAFNIVVLDDGTLVVSYSGRRTSNFTASSGVFVSTDGGQTWADRSDPGMDYWTKDVVVDPGDPSQNTWYAGVYSGFGGASNGLGGLYMTTNRGQSWSRITTGLDRVESITINPTNTNEAYLTTETQGLWFSSNMRAANPTFTQVAGYSFRQPERVFFNPYNPNEVWVTSFGSGVRVGSVAPPATVSGLQINDGSEQRSMVRSLTVTFSGPVTFANNNPTAAFQLTRVGGGAVGLSAALSVNGSGGTVVTLTFVGSAEIDPTSIQNGGVASLADGRFSLTILANAINDAGGQSLDGDGDGGVGGNYVSPTDTAAGGMGQLRLFRLYGDATGDGFVDALDLVALRSAINTTAGSPAYLAFLDENNDGVIDALDLSVLRSRINTNVF